MSGSLARHDATVMRLGWVLEGTEDANVDPPHGVIACSQCATVQKMPVRAGHGVVHCRTCENPLEHTVGRSLDGALACSFATFLLLFPANLVSLLNVTILGAYNRSVIASGVLGIWHQGWPLVAIVVGIEIVILPFFRFGLLTAVLGALRLDLRAPWIGPAFRWAEHLDEWSMPDVFLFGCIVGYSRVAPFLPVEIGAGGYCLICAAILTLITRSTLERQALWRMIKAPPETIEPDMIGCVVCSFAMPGSMDGGRCPRCRAKVWRVRPFATMESYALTAAGFVFYPVAYLYPMEYSDRINTLHGYSIMTGVMKLLQANLWFFAIVVFVASIMIPLLKLFALCWFALSIHHHSPNRLKLKTKLYRVVNAIGRWSHIDVYTIAVFLPLMHLPGFLSVIVGRALPAFLAVVVITMFATEIFDPRELWLAAETPR
jgi:paraquat-inducible protein A